MLVSINPNSEEPIYLQIYDSFVSAIASGELKADDLLPSSRKLAKDLRINYITVNRAYDLLESEGFVSVENKRTKVVTTSKRSRQLFIRKWKRVERDLTIEARAKSISNKELVKMFTDFVNSL